MSVPSKAVVIGLDAGIPSRWFALAGAGKLPNLQRLVDRGVAASRCFVPYPTLTPPNWTTISTGAMAATHGIVDFHLHTAGDPLDRVWQAFDSRVVGAERLWTSWARAGASAIVINYPVTWPPTVENGLQIGGHGLDLNEWRTREELGYSASASGMEYLIDLAGCDLLSTFDDPLAAPIEWREAAGWNNQPPEAMEAECAIRFRRARSPVHEERAWHLLLHEDGVRVSFGRSSDDLLAELAPGTWSSLLRTSFLTSAGPREAVYRIKLLHHDYEKRELRLFVTPLCGLGEGVHPPDWASRLAAIEGLPLPIGEAWEAFSLGWIDADTLLELEDMEHEWFGDAIVLADESLNWSLLMLHDHGPDWFAHLMLRDLDPALTDDVQKRAAAERFELVLYQSLDRLIGRIVEIAGPDAVIVVVSDHGQIPNGPFFNPRLPLEEAQLIVYEQGEGERREGILVSDAFALEDTPTFMIDEAEPDMFIVEPRSIDWSQTRAVPQGCSYIYVNLRGRDPEGVVSEGEEYDAVCDAVIAALLTYRDPATGLRPVSLALRRKDAQVLGLPDSDVIGDVVYALDRPYGAGHAQHLPTLDYGIGSLNALLVLAGPGLREGVRLERRVGLEDIVPTLSYLLRLPIPKDAEGGVIYQALVNPDETSDQIRSLQNKNDQLEKVRRAYERSVAITHSYNTSVTPEA
jgi:predicted AlkP superfamily phosphohydrolase/phosphomutase